MDTSDGFVVLQFTILRNVVEQWNLSFLIHLCYRTPDTKPGFGINTQGLRGIHFVFSDNSGVFLRVSLMIFVSLEAGMNNVQFTYFVAWWLYNCVTSHVIKFYFTESFLRLNVLSCEGKILTENLLECKRFSTKTLIKQEWKRQTLNPCKRCKQPLWVECTPGTAGHVYLWLQITLLQSQFLDVRYDSYDVVKF